MTISLEEHVARAMQAEWVQWGDGQPWGLLLERHLARAAIAAVREREGEATGVGDDEGFIVGVNCGPDAPDPAEAMRAKDVDAATGCADDQVWAEVPSSALRAALKGNGEGR